MGHLRNSIFRFASYLLCYILQLPYNLPYSEFVSADPSFEDMNAVVNLKVRSYLGFTHNLFHSYNFLYMQFDFKFNSWNHHSQKIRPSTSQFGWSSSSSVSEVSTLMKECWQANASARPPMLRAKKTLIRLLDERIVCEEQVIQKCYFSMLRINEDVFICVSIQKDTVYICNRN